MSNQYRQQTETPQQGYGITGVQGSPYAGYMYQMPAGYQHPSFQQPSLQVPGMPTSQTSGGPQVPGMLPIEQSYIENILRLNKGKVATVYMTFENKVQGNEKVFKGVIEAAGRDHIILSDPQTEKRYLLLMIYVDYITFDEEIAYNVAFGGGQRQY